MTLPTDDFTDAQRDTFEAMRERYAEDQDHLSSRDRANLAFFRWLMQQGRAGSGDDAASFDGHLDTIEIFVRSEIVA